jgi:SAM-dependent methyltransferase
MLNNQQQALAVLKELLEDYQKLIIANRAVLADVNVIRLFVDRLLRDVLGWEISDSARYKYIFRAETDYSCIILTTETNDSLLLELVGLDANNESKDLNRLVQKRDHQYSFDYEDISVSKRGKTRAFRNALANNCSWVIQTNFETLRLFSVQRGSLLLSFKDSQSYLSGFEKLLDLSYQSVLGNRLNQLNNLHHLQNIVPQYLDFNNRWRRKLVDHMLQRKDRNLSRAQSIIDIQVESQRVINWLVLVRFAEDHDFVPSGTLQQFYELCVSNLYAQPMYEYLIQFFERFEEQHNVRMSVHKLFADTSLGDEVLLPLLANLFEINYQEWSSDALCLVSEQYLQSLLTVNLTETSELHFSDVSHTQLTIVHHLVDITLGRFLYGTFSGQPDGESIEGEVRKTSYDIQELRILDSACGTGQFLLYAYHVLANFYEMELIRLTSKRKALGQLVDPEISGTEESIKQLDAEIKRISDFPSLILDTHLYGVDINPLVAEIAAINLGMCVIERNQHKNHMPWLLNRNIKTGNSLVGTPPETTHWPSDPLMLPGFLDHSDEITDSIGVINRLRSELCNVRDKAIEQHILQEIEQKTFLLRNRLDTDFQDWFNDLTSISFFHWGIEFPEVFFDENGGLLEEPGFTLIIGNPPWETVKPDIREFYAQFDPDIRTKLSRSQIEQRIEELNRDNPTYELAWEEHKRVTDELVSYIRKGQHYEFQRGPVLMHQLFLEKMYGLLRKRGRLGYFLPDGFLSDFSAAELRKILNKDFETIARFSNSHGLLPKVHSDFKMCLVSIQKNSLNDYFVVFP